MRGIATPQPAMQAHVPTLAIFQDLVESAPADRVTLDWLLSSLRERSFGIVTLLMALVSLVPGASRSSAFCWRSRPTR